MVAALSAVIAGCWIYLLAGAGLAGHGMTEAAMSPAAWSAGYALLVLVMWWVMMVGMMLPSAAPMILLFTRVNRRARERGGPSVAPGFFVTGYALAWGGFSVGAVALQWGLERSGLLSAMMTVSSGALGGALLVSAGLYQLSPMKRRCLSHCRSPLDYLAHRWQSGTRGALRMGLGHGAYCLGCCWALMGLLFYGGVMNLVWIAGLALYVLLEKTVPAGHGIGRGLGWVLVAWGVVVIVGP